jgi:hypothetical protein
MASSASKLGAREAREAYTRSVDLETFYRPYIVILPHSLSRILYGLKCLRRRLRSVLPSGHAGKVESPGRLRCQASLKAPADTTLSRLTSRDACRSDRIGRGATNAPG